MAMKLCGGRFFGNLEKTISTETARYSRTFYKSGLQQPAHSHELPHICLTVQGDYSELISGKTKSIPRGALTFYHPEQIHQEFHPSAGIHFLMEIFPHEGSLIQTILPQFARDPVPAGHGVNLAWRLYREFCSPDIFSSLAMEALALEILVEVFRKNKGAVQRQRPAWMSTVIAVLHEEFPLPVSLSKLAADVGVHPVHLAKTFRAFEGRTIGEYARRLKIDYAREKLSTTGLPLAQIALDAGFYDQTHFARVFKRYTGLTPRQFRRLASR